ncbi:MAG: hypothetical protein OXI13_06330 [Gammaproteobacteria bacterium]|nr:hypothetical protein [Gammaproteobacteria bacterium]
MSICLLPDLRFFDRGYFPFPSRRFDGMPGSAKNCPVSAAVHVNEQCAGACRQFASYPLIVACACSSGRPASAGVERENAMRGNHRNLEVIHYFVVKEQLERDGAVLAVKPKDKTAVVVVVADVEILSNYSVSSRVIHLHLLAERVVRLCERGQGEGREQGGKS